MIRHGHQASLALRQLPVENIAHFLELYAGRIEAARAALVDMAHIESALPKKPRLDEVELPRTVNQLRQAAAAAREGSWALPTIDTKAGIRSMYAALEGPVTVFGPNNFPFAFNSAAGGDFAAAIAAGNPVIAKANTSHPGTTRLFAVEALAAAIEAGLPPATVQLIYRTDHETGKLLVAHPLVAATGYTGSRSAGLTLKEAADKAGKPIYLELSSINPVVILPGRAAHARRRRGRRVHRFVPDGHRAVLHQPRADPAAGRGRERSLHRSGEGQVPGGAGGHAAGQVGPGPAGARDGRADQGRRPGAGRRAAGRRPRLQLQQHAAAHRRRAAS